MSKGTWKQGDLTFEKIVYNGKVIKDLTNKKGDNHNDQVRTGEQNEQKGSQRA